MIAELRSLFVGGRRSVDGERVDALPRKVQGEDDVEAAVGLDGHVIGRVQPLIGAHRWRARRMVRDRLLMIGQIEREVDHLANLKLQLDGIGGVQRQRRIAMAHRAHAQLREQSDIAAYLRQW